MTAAKPTINYPIITKVVSRNYTIVVTSGANGPVYTVIGGDGNPLVDHITLAAMKQTNPKLFNRLSPALAMGNVDASVRD